MNTYFECKVRYEKIMENGMKKIVTEPYLVDALSFTEAEARIIEEMTPFISGEFTISDIKRANYSEVFPSMDASADRWFKCKLDFITLDEKSGAEKKASTYMLVQAADLRDAVKELDEHMKGSMADYRIASMAETAIMDVYPYEAKGEGTEQDSGVSVQKLIADCPAGQFISVEIAGAKVIIDKSDICGPTVVRPVPPEQEGGDDDAGRDEGA